jgi:hypothetical protein
MLHLSLKITFGALTIKCQNETSAISWKGGFSRLMMAQNIFVVFVYQTQTQVWPQL